MVTDNMIPVISDEEHCYLSPNPQQNKWQSVLKK